MDIKSLIKPYSPWLDGESLRRWEATIPTYRRPVFGRLLEDLDSIPQMLSITGPPGVGKSTLLQQMVQELLGEREIPPERLVYYSLDDPAQFQMPARGEAVLDQLMTHLGELGRSGPAYLFLDEIQTFPRWEQYLKKYYDLKFPVKTVLSGSASSPIFKKSRESLLGRVKDYHILPFSFREFLQFRLHERDDEAAESLRREGGGNGARNTF